MRKIIVATLLALAFASPAQADGGLTEAVASAWFPRTVDADLHAMAHERVPEISACGSCMNHDGMRPGTAEVLGYNGGFSNPIAQVIDDWASSAVHDGILSDRSYGRIGCAERVAGNEHWFVCVLASGGSGSGGTAVTTFAMPDTAMPH